MTALVYAPRFAAAMEAVFEFVAERDPARAAARVETIIEALDLLRRHPLIGRRVDRRLRELVIGRGHDCFVALYAWDEPADRVVVLNVRHARQAGYR